MENCLLSQIDSTRITNVALKEFIVNLQNDSPPGICSPNTAQVRANSGYADHVGTRHHDYHDYVDTKDDYDGTYRHTDEAEKVRYSYKDYSDHHGDYCD